MNDNLNGLSDNNEPENELKFLPNAEHDNTHNVSAALINNNKKVSALNKKNLLIVFVFSMLAAISVFFLVSFVLKNSDSNMIFSNLPSAMVDGIHNATDSENHDSTEVPSDDKNLNTSTKIKPENIKGTFFTPGADYNCNDSGAKSIDDSVAYLASNNFNALYLPVLTNSDIIYNSTVLNTNGFDVLDYIIEKSHSFGMIVIPVVDISIITDNSTANLKKIKQVLSELCDKPIDGLMIDGYYTTIDTISYSQYCTLAGGSGYMQYRLDRSNSVIKSLSDHVRTKSDTLYFGVISEPIWDNSSNNMGVSVNKNAFQTYSDGGADIVSWLNNGIIDGAVIKNNYSTENSETTYTDITDWWISKVTKGDLCFMMYSEYICTENNGWKSADQLLKQAIFLNTTTAYGFVVSNYTAFSSDKTGSTSAFNKYISGKLDSGYVIKDLTFTTPSKTEFSTTSSVVPFLGASDPQFELKLNGNLVERTELGYFSLSLDLSLGINEFVFVHKGATVTYKITYNKIIIKEMYPSSAIKIESGATMIVAVIAQSKSKTTATLNGATITLVENQIVDDNGNATDEFSNYRGSFIMPTVYANTNIGAVSVTVNSKYGNETRTGGKITVSKLASPPIDGNTPTGGDYINVGGGLIAEVIPYQAETFSGTTSDDYSRPTNNYLPAGTVDYCSANTVYDPSSKNNFRTLRYGNRLYTNTSQQGDVLRVYAGTLPDGNNVSIAGVLESSKTTSMVINTAWKAPFRLNYCPQGYYNPTLTAVPNYNISSFTASYIDITFCYAKDSSGIFDITADNPIFSRGEWIKNQSDYTLRLHLKKAGGFYGWDVNYNSSNQLVFTFTHPAKISSANNQYGVSLDGVKIMLDAGHGGRDPGALGSNPAYNEAVLNLSLSYKIKDRLESLGATVIMTRTGNTAISLDERVRKIKSQKPDVFLSIHRNSSTSSRASGYDSFYFSPFSQKLSGFVNKRNASLYTVNRGSTWNPLYVARATDCPSILTENGFVSNAAEYSNMVNNNTYNNNCADATVAGIVDYFKSIQ